MTETKNEPKLGSGLEEDVVLQALGARVRALRTSKGLPRRVLSETSGVSPRYLAQLESGQGNISVLLLSRVARALGQPLDVLLGAPAADAADVANAYASADPSVQASVADLLQLPHLTRNRSRRLCLIGLRGAGKSTLGRAMSKRFGAPFVELNAEIEKQGAMPVSEIIALYGPEGYREIEGRAVVEVAEAYDHVILAVGGGIVSDRHTYRYLRQRFHTIWVKAHPEEHMERVRLQGDMRPMEGNPRAMVQLQGLLNSREAAYTQADATLDTSGKSLGQSEGELAALVRHYGFLG
jgi:XRE family aerobic/anaerobic benzoate catabolism transcriptional regulator